MSEKKFNSLCEFIELAFLSVVYKVGNFSFVKNEENYDIEKTKLPVTIYIELSGENIKGTTNIKMSMGGANILAEKLSNTPSEHVDDMYLGLSEFTNIFCGNAVTFFNNEYNGSNLRVYPPKIFLGNKTKKNKATVKYVKSDFYESKYGAALINIEVEYI